MTDPLLSVNLSAWYGTQPALRNLQFAIARGEVLGLVGTSGAGKSTLALALMGLLQWRGGRLSGEVLLNGQNLLRMKERELRRLRGRRIAFVPQSPMSALNLAVSLRAHFEETWRAHETGVRRALEERLRRLLPEVQLPSDTGFLSRKPSQISVGQAQRVLLALALLHGPALLIADEPTSALDPVTQAEIIRLLRHVNRSLGAALLLISHDLISVLQMADRIAVLDSGAVVECLPVADIESLAVHPTTRRLLSSLPVAISAILANRDLEVVAGATELGDDYSYPAALISSR